MYICVSFPSVIELSYGHGSLSYMTVFSGFSIKKYVAVCLFTTKYGALLVVTGKYRHLLGLLMKSPTKQGATVLSITETRIVQTPGPAVFADEIIYKVPLF